MIKIMFVCHGNICRSPLAEFLMKELVTKEGQIDNFYICSAATSTEEIGNPIYPPIKQILNSNGIDCSQKKAVRVKKYDYYDFDFLICMDKNNLHNLSYIIGSDIDNKVYRLLDFTNNPRDVADPWYTRDFKSCENDIRIGCKAFYDFIIKSNYF